MAILQDVVTAWRLLWNPRVSLGLKLLLPVAAMVYWIWPIDLIPGLPLDDIAVLLLALRAFVMLAPQDAVRNARNQADAGNGDDDHIVDTTWRRVE